MLGSRNRSQSRASLRPTDPGVSRGIRLRRGSQGGYPHLRMWLLISIGEGVLSQQERPRCRWAAIDRVDRIGILGLGREPPHFAGSQVDDDLAENLTAAIGCAQRGRARLNVERVAFGVCPDRWWVKHRPQGDSTQENSNGEQQDFRKLIVLHITTPVKAR
jgi:hypothetical protein